VNECSLQAASPLYQSFNLYLRKKWMDKYGSASLPSPPKDKIHIVIEVRKINKNKQNSHSSARYIRNLDELIKALQTIPNVLVTAQDFASISFEKQVALSHSASIFISMHGAGMSGLQHDATSFQASCPRYWMF
jgi:hypothetical protein